jgi:hypothetical protein
MALTPEPGPNTEPTRTTELDARRSLGQVLDDQYRELAGVVVAYANDLERPAPGQPGRCASVNRSRSST